MAAVPSLLPGPTRLLNEEEEAEWEEARKSRNSNSSLPPSKKHLRKQKRFLAQLRRFKDIRSLPSGLMGVQSLSQEEFTLDCQEMAKVATRQPPGYASSLTAGSSEGDSLSEGEMEDGEDGLIMVGGMMRKLEKGMNSQRVMKRLLI